LAIDAVAKVNGSAVDNVNASFGRPLMQFRDTEGRSRYVADADSQRMLDTDEKTRMQLTSDALSLLDENEVTRSGVSTKLLALFDQNGTVRFAADTLDENNTAITLLDSNGFKRTRLSAKGDVRTFDESGFDRFMVDETGSMRLLDGDIEAIVVDKFGLFGSDNEGNVTLSYNRLSGKVAAAGDIEKDAPPARLAVDELYDSYADYCSRENYANPAALRACSSPQTAELLDRMGKTVPSKRTSSAHTYQRPSGAHYDTGAAFAQSGNDLMDQVYKAVYSADDGRREAHERAIAHARAAREACVRYGDCEGSDARGNRTAANDARDPFPDDRFPRDDGFDDGRDEGFR